MSKMIEKKVMKDHNNNNNNNKNTTKKNTTSTKSLPTRILSFKFQTKEDDNFRYYDIALVGEKSLV